MTKLLTLHVARDFTPYLGGRFYSDGPGSGEALRALIEKGLECNERVRVVFDGVALVSPSFLEEVFGGLARLAGEDTEAIGRLRARIDVVCTERPVICIQAFRYFDNAANSQV